MSHRHQQTREERWAWLVENAAFSIRSTYPEFGDLPGSLQTVLAAYIAAVAEEFGGSMHAACDHIRPAVKHAGLRLYAESAERAALAVESSRG